MTELLIAVAVGALIFAIGAFTGYRVTLKICTAIVKSQKGEPGMPGPPGPQGPMGMPGRNYDDTD